MAPSRPEHSDRREIPSSTGTYALILHSHHRRLLQAGKLGTFYLLPGWYVYIGSAFGPGGLRARCFHHRTSAGRPHWHIDYLRLAAQPEAVWFTTDPVRREHQWAELMPSLRQALNPCPRFGASDCRCQSHLVFFPSRPEIRSFRMEIRSCFPGHGPIRSHWFAAI
ncbi:MAG: GIY-YIG nuclease family protein [Hyphomicrobiales bacterium]